MPSTTIIECSLFELINKQGFKKLFCLQPHFHVGYFMTCAVLGFRDKFGLAPYPKLLVSVILVILQSFRLLSKSEQFLPLAALLQAYPKLWGSNCHSK